MIADVLGMKPREFIRRAVRNELAAVNKVPELQKVRDAELAAQKARAAAAAAIDRARRA